MVGRRKFNLKLLPVVVPERCLNVLNICRRLLLATFALALLMTSPSKLPLQLVVNDISLPLANPTVPDNKPPLTRRTCLPLAKIIVLARSLITKASFPPTVTGTNLALRTRATVETS